jgi:hypothetical protein
MSKPSRPKVSIRFKYNVDTGEIEEFLVDDNAPERSDEYHDKVARTLAGLVARRAEIEDAGPRHLAEGDRIAEAPPTPEVKKDVQTD